MALFARAISILVLAATCLLPLASAEAADGDVPTSGNYVADIGFRPNVNGFPFENYGNEVAGLTNLTADDVRTIFGDAVCANIHGGKCTLTPEAEEWMAAKNQGMNGGH